MKSIVTSILSVMAFASFATAEDKKDIVDTAVAAG